MTENSFQEIYCAYRGALLAKEPVRVGKWHNVDVSSSDLHQFREIVDVHFKRRMAPTMELSQKQIKPNLPWAEDHFQERISGEPLNPPPSEAWWPFGNTKVHKHGEQFSHSYPERFWPKEAGPYVSRTLGHQRYHLGIRYGYGDLGDVIELLRREPMTRQAVLPVWFPEDTGNTANVRLPCSLTYQFQIRDGLMRCTYTMRSVDFWRHFRDDVYMAERLTQWICEELDSTLDVKPGMLTMNIANLHLLEGDVVKAREEALCEAL